MENGQEIGGTEGEADASDVFLRDLQCIEAEYLTARIEQRAAGVAGVDGGVGLDPGAGAKRGKFSDGADDTFCGAKQHGVTGIADSEDGFALLDNADVGKNEKWESVAGRRRIGFDECNVEVGVDINDTGLQLNFVWKDSEKR